MTQSPIRWRKIILLIVAIMLLVWCGLITRAVLILRDDVLTLQDYATTLPDPLTPDKIDLPLIQRHVTSIHQNLSSLRSIGAPLLALAPAFGWLPDIGGDVRAAPALLNLALEFTDLGDRATRMLAPFWPPPAGNGRLSLETLTRILQVLQPAMQSFRANIERAGTIRETIDTTSLSARPRSILERFDAAYPALSTGLDLAGITPQLLGADRPRTYLIMLQNEDELRPTGGFISAAGRVTLSAGKIVTLTVSDSYTVDDFTKPYGPTPQPMLDYMSMHLWVFRDSNWSPDFPAAARQAIELYTYAQGGMFDGVIALNQNVVEALVTGLGPLTIDPQQPPLTAQNIRAYMRNAWAPNGQTDLNVWFLNRKEFIGRLMEAMLNRMLNHTNEIDWGELGNALNAALNSHDLLIMLIDPALNQTLRDTGWDGALPDPPADFLMIVDANLGYNKANLLIREAITYTVSLNSYGSATSTLAIGYTHLGSAVNGCPHVVTPYTLSTTYDLLAQQCYWDYRRILVPLGSTLIDSTRHPTKPGELITGLISDGATSTLTDTGKTAFGTLLIVGRGATIESEVRYALPDGIIQRDGEQRVYRLHVQKQSGAGHWPLTINVQWPTIYEYVDAKPKPVSVSKRSAIFQLTLEADIDLSVTLR